MEPLADRPAIDWQRFDDLLRQAFSARRKQLRNALPLKPADFAALHIDAQLRPEDLSPQDYVRITQQLGLVP
jgi:16S rRNA A1518/A1519 N6-dimethyltransferase RsmA/KsgA/DIM1 with predicted DNA glycosylase/AP lyase activity